MNTTRFIRSVSIESEAHDNPRLRYSHPAEMRAARVSVILLDTEGGDQAQTPTLSVLIPTGFS